MQTIIGAIMNLTIALAMELTMQFEGFSPTIYECPAGYPSIGYGRNLKFYPLNKIEEESLIWLGAIEEEEAEAWLKDRLIQIYQEVQDKPYFVNQSPQRQAAMLDMIYNMGLKSFNEFKKFQQAMIAKDYSLAAKELATGSGEGGKSKWLLQTKSRAEKIISIIETGEI